MKYLKWLPAVSIACISFYLSSQPHLEHMPSFWNADKLVHLVCYAGFCFWTCFGFGADSWKKVWIPVLSISLWGLSDEIHQSFVPGRSVSFLDWLADTLGAVLGGAVYVVTVLKISEWRKNGEKNPSPAQNPCGKD